MTARRILAYVPLLVAFGFLISCNLGIEVPDYFIDVRTEDLQIAYNNGTSIEVEYKFIAENDQHRCKYIVADGSAVELQSQLTDYANAGQWNPLPPIDVSSSEGKYSVRIIVQSETSDGQFVDLSFLDKSVVFYFDQTPPSDQPEISSTPTLSSQPVDIVLTHSDQLDPNASPVTIYYTLGGVGPTEYSGLIRLDIPEQEANNDIELVAYAMDSVNVAPSPEASHSYRFLNMDWISNVGGTDKITDEDRYVDPEVPVVIKELHGVGFSFLTNPETSASVYDHDGTSVLTTLTPLSGDRVRIFINIDVDPIEDPVNTGFEAGSGTIVLKDSATNVSDTIEIVIGQKP